MKSRPYLVASSVASALSMATAALAQTQVGGPVPVPTFKAEKCYGIAKAGKNDCQTASSACASTSRSDNQGDAWIYVPAGTCDRIVGGSLSKKG